MSWGGYGLQLGQAASVGHHPMYASVASDAMALGGGQVLLRGPGGGPASIVSLQVSQALELCRAFAPMDLHAQRVCQQVPGLQGQESAVRAVLNDMVRRGLLTRAEEWLDGLCAAPSQALAPFRTVIIRTCERPQTLVALLDSLREQTLRWRSEHRYLLVDMSRDPATVRSNRRALDAFGAATRCHTAHIDRSAQQRHLDELRRAAPQHADGLDYLLGDCGSEIGYHGDYGVSLNWMNLLGAGERYALLDDDHLFPLRWHPEWSAGIDLVDQPEPARLFADLEQALASGQESETDPLAAHADLCGASLGQVLRTAALRPQMSQLRGLVPDRVFSAGAQSRVLSSVHGHRGDSYSMSLLWLMALPASVRDQRLADPAAYRRTLDRPASAQVASRYRMLESCGLTPFMVDGSQLMPAVPPRGRGEDAVFCALLRAVHRDSLQIELPMSIGHHRQSVPDRGEFPDEPATPALALVLSEQLRQSSKTLRSADPQLRLNALCVSFEEQAAQSPTEATAYLTAFLHGYRARVVEGLRHALNDAPPPHWAADLRRLIEANGHALLQQAPARFAEWPATTDAAQGASLWLSYLSRFASALRAWPEAISMARDRNSQWLGAS